MRVEYAVDMLGRPGTDSVFRAVNVNGGYYLYYYNASNERIRKELPIGNTEEYFWGPSHQLLEDRGTVSAVGSNNAALDEYVWLGGRPVVMWRSGFNSSWVRANDLTAGGCPRYGETADCAPYSIVTDHIGKPVLMLNYQGHVSGVGEYETFGHVDRVNWLMEPAHPYPPVAGNAIVGDFQQATAGMSIQMR